MSDRHLPCDYSACAHPTCVARERCLRQRVSERCCRQVWSGFAPPEDGPCESFIATDEEQRRRAALAGLAESDADLIGNR